MRHRLALAAAAVVAGALLVPAAPASASETFCQYKVSSSYATIYATPSTSGWVYDAMPYGSSVTASLATYTGPGGPFRKLIAAYGTAYARSADLTRVTSGFCMSPMRAAD